MRNIVLTLLLIACSSKSSSSGTLPPGQIDTVGPDDPSAPIEPPPPSTAPSGGQGVTSLPGCPSVRPDAKPTTELASADDLRALVAGIYRTCGGGKVGLELRADPNSSRLLFHTLDERFVRLEGPGTSGWIDIGECAGASCAIEQYDEDATLKVTGELRVWTGPVAIEVASPSDFEAHQAWVHVAD